jgi:sporulation protein YlmC with PRC-barrel domain
MNVKASALIHRSVVSLSDGMTVGQVSGLMLDATHVKVQSLILAGHDGNSNGPSGTLGSTP